MKFYFIHWILRQVFGRSPLAEFSSPVQTGKGWVCTLTDKVNGDVYLCQFVPIESEKVVVPNMFNELMRLNQGDQK